MIDMQGLSFREYLEMFHGIKTPVLTFQQIVNDDHISIEGVEHPLPLFQRIRFFNRRIYI